MGANDKITGPFPTTFQSIDDRSKEPAATVGDKIFRYGGSWGQGDLREPVTLYGEVMGICADHSLRVQYKRYSIGSYGAPPQSISANKGVFQIGSTSHQEEECVAASEVSVEK